ncbi:MAG: exosome protein [Vulcanisaeta sp.]|jgi:hypothetical protein|nr:exosome protein [Vulcanisaeta sp.]
MGITITQLEVEVYVHATENIDKVVNSILEFITTNAPIVIEVLYGHYGNPIYRITSLIDDQRLTREILTRICSSLVNKDRLINTINIRVDSKGNVYIRLDKQEFVRGRFVLNDGDDVVRVRVKVSGDIAEFINEFCR